MFKEILGSGSLQFDSYLIPRVTRQFVTQGGVSKKCATELLVEYSTLGSARAIAETVLNLLQMEQKEKEAKEREEKEREAKKKRKRKADDSLGNLVRMVFLKSDLLKEVLFRLFCNGDFGYDEIEKAFIEASRFFQSSAGWEGRQDKKRFCAVWNEALYTAYGTGGKEMLCLKQGVK